MKFMLDILWGLLLLPVLFVAEFVIWLRERKRKR